MRALGMDLGTKTLGLATSDKSGLIASPYKTIRYSSMDELVGIVIDLIDELHIEELVLGLPKNMNNTSGPAAERSLEFKSALESKINMEVHLVDERLSTVEATNVLLDYDMSRKKRKEVVDSIAASIILDTYLRMKRKED